MQNGINWKRLILWFETSSLHELENIEPKVISELLKYRPVIEYAQDNMLELERRIEDTFGNYRSLTYNYVELTFEGIEHECRFHFSDLIEGNKRRRLIIRTQTKNSIICSPPIRNVIIPKLSRGLEKYITSRT